MTRRYAASVESPIGRIIVVVDDAGAVEQISFGAAADGESLTFDDTRCHHAVEQLKQYFEGERTSFDLPLAPAGTLFQRQVWELLRRIPFGQTISYPELAKRAGNVKAIRAVGRANGANPIAIVVPCHRVIGADGSLVGYAGGVDVKRALLEHERALPRHQRPLF